jgi:hypothetical protein
VFADQTRFGQSLHQALAGSAVGLVDDLLGLTVGNAQRLARGDETQLASDLIRFARRYTPGGSLWYARLAYERLLLDQLQAWVDPDAERRFRETQRRQLKDFGNRYWWGPGRRAPARGPQLSGG